MDLIKTITDLCREKAEMERLIASLEELDATGSIRELRQAKEKLERVSALLEELHAAGSIPQKGWRSRRPMSIEERSGSVG